MNYILSIQLEGADEFGRSLDAVDAGAQKTMKSFSVLDAWGKAMFKNISDSTKALKWYESAVKTATKETDNFWKSATKVGALGLGKPKMPEWVPGAQITGASNGEAMDAHVADFYKHHNEALDDAFNKRPLVGMPIEAPGESMEGRESKIKKEAMEARRRDLMEKDALHSTTDRAKFYKDMTFLLMPMMNPGSVWATLFSTRQTFSAFTQSEKGRGMVGGTIGGAAWMTAGLVGASTAIGLAFAALKKTVDGATEAIHKAFGLYTGAAMQGLSTKFFTQRSVLADVLGVKGNPNQVFMFGAAVQYVADRTKHATDILSSTARPLAELDIQWKIMLVDVSAMFAKLASDAGPAIKDFIVVLDSFVKSVTDNVSKIETYSRWSTAIVTLGSSEVLRKLWHGAAQSVPSGNMPGLFGGMKQLPASSWERMGLIVASAGGQNYAARTAKGVERSVTYLALISGAILKSNAGGPVPQHNAP